MTKGLHAFLAVVTRDAVLTWRTGGAGLAVAFFFIALALLPLAIGPDRARLAAVSPGLVWVLGVLAVLLTFERLFQGDLEDGVIDLAAGAAFPLELFAAAKTCAHFLATGLPLALAAPVGALMLGLDLDGAAPLFAAFVIGMPGLSATGAIAASLTAGLRRSGLLLSLLVLPLTVPFVIFGAGAAAPGPAAGPSLMLLGAATLIAIAAALLLVPRALKSQID